MVLDKRLDLEFCIDSMRITDLDEQETEEASVSNIYDKLKRKTSNVAQVQDDMPVMDNAINNSDRLRSILKKAD